MNTTVLHIEDLMDNIMLIRPIFQLRSYNPMEAQLSQHRISMTERENVGTISLDPNSHKFDEKHKDLNNGA